MRHIPDGDGKHHSCCWVSYLPVTSGRLGLRIGGGAPCHASAILWLRWALACGGAVPKEHECGRVSTSPYRSRTKPARLWRTWRVRYQTRAFVRRFAWVKAWVRAHNRHGMDRFGSRPDLWCKRSHGSNPGIAKVPIAGTSRMLPLRWESVN